MSGIKRAANVQAAAHHPAREAVLTVMLQRISIRSYRGRLTGRKERKMGDSTGSMLIFFGIIIAVYIVGATVYTVVEKIKKGRKDR